MQAKEKATDLAIEIGIDKVNSAKLLGESEASKAANLEAKKIADTTNKANQPLIDLNVSLHGLPVIPSQPVSPNQSIDGLDKSLIDQVLKMPRKSKTGESVKLIENTPNLVEESGSSTVHT